MPLPPRYGSGPWWIKTTAKLVYRPWVMTYDEVHPTMRQVLGCYEGLRKLGFVPDDIWVCMFKADAVVAVILRTQGKEFVITCGKISATQPEFEAMWDSATRAVLDYSLSQEALDQIWHESMIYQRSSEFVLALIDKGIRIPAASGKLN